MEVVPPTAVTDDRVGTSAHAGRRQPADWRARAACRDMDTELFFPAGDTGPALAQTARAKAVCELCMVRVPCLVWALANGHDAGVWGGTTEDERRALQPARARRALARLNGAIRRS